MSVILITVPNILCYVCAGWMAVICQRDAVKLWPQFSAPTPLVWESWTWVPMICRIQEWSCSLLDWGVHTVHWKLSGQFYSMVKQLHHKFHIRGRLYNSAYNSVPVMTTSVILYHWRFNTFWLGGYCNTSICLQSINYTPESQQRGHWVTCVT